MCMCMFASIITYIGADSLFFSFRVIITPKQLYTLVVVRTVKGNTCCEHKHTCWTTSHTAFIYKCPAVSMSLSDDPNFNTHLRAGKHESLV